MQKILRFRLQVESSQKKISALVLGQDMEDLDFFVDSLHKAYSGELVRLAGLEVEKTRYFSYEKSRVNGSLQIVKGFPSVFECRSFKFEGESWLHYYTSRYSLKTISDFIRFNLRTEDSPNALVIVINGGKTFPDLFRFRTCIEDFKSSGIIYPHVVVTNLEKTTEKEEIIEKLCLGLRLPRSSCHFVSTYHIEEWEMHLEKDYFLLEFLADLVI